MNDTILIVDDDHAVLASLELLLKQAGYRSMTADTPEAALAALAAGDVALVLQDMNFSRTTSGNEGLDLLRRVRETAPGIPVILITAWGSIGLAVEGMKTGAADFITKPWTREQILGSVGTALGLAEEGAHAAPTDAVPTREDLDTRYDLQGIVGRDTKLRGVLDLVGRIAKTDASVLITGASGTGKELLAEAVHRNSPRRDGPFVKVNLGGISGSLFESEMFGHVRGAFTDAVRDREGRFARAEGGTIFLDEIGDLELGSQVKLLRVLQDRTYEVLGNSVTRTLDVRVVSATNRDLPAAIEAGTFREDLLYRLNLITVQLPSLEERPADIPILITHFMAQARTAYHRPNLTVSDPAIAWLKSRSWPGNVRQLRQILERTLLVADTDLLEPSHFERTLRMDHSDPGDDTLPPVGAMTMEEIEKAMILKSLEFHAGNISRAADSLGLSRPAFYRRLEKHGIPT